MEAIMIRVTVLAAVLVYVVSVAAAPFENPDGKDYNWYKGNTHTHTINSDGDSSPDEVCRWYKEHRYDFVVITDHNFNTPVDGLNAVYAAKERFLVVAGEEVTDSYREILTGGERGKYSAIHMNAINSHETIGAQGGNSVLDVLQRDIDAINAQHAVVHLNHPNFHWSFDHTQMALLKNFHMFEIYNAHPTVNNAGGGGLVSTDAMWDSLLTRGILMHGVASDDAHHFKTWGPNKANPGRGWVVIRAESLNVDGIVAALESGNFYASNGVELSDITLENGTLTVGMEESGTLKYTTEFIGKGGKLLKKDVENPAVYKISGNEGYVRARVTDSNGHTAWVQPVMVD